MKITAITCTYQRHEAFALCDFYMARQIRQPDQWLVLDAAEPMRDKVLAAVESGRVEGDAVVFFEDDDWYHRDWLKWCEERLERYDIAGQGMALYYNVATRWWNCCANVRHASLCNTGMRAELLPALANVIRGYDNNFFDTRLWRLDYRRCLQLPSDADRMVIGIKGMPGRKGYSPEHNQEVPPNVNRDYSAKKLWELLGDDAQSYLSFYDHNFSN